MALSFVSRNGQRLTPYMLYQLDRLNAAFKARWGVELIVTSGIRTHQEQIDIFVARYVKAGNVRGRRVYDTRVWNGVTWYRVSAAGTVAVPGTSNHEVQGTSGAMDIRDTGNDAGVTVKTSARGRWIRAEYAKYDMEAEGDNFGEGWHVKVRNIGNAVPGSGGGGGMDKQQFLNSLGYDTGAPGWGPKCAAATADFQRGVGLDPDGDFGPKTVAVMETILKGGNYSNRPVKDIQAKLTENRIDVGPIDNEWGNKLSRGVYIFQRQNGLTADAQYGAATDAKLFPPVVTPPPVVVPPKPVPGRNATTRPLKEIQKFLKVAETGVWDQATADAVFAFQKSKAITADYIWGSTSDSFAFPPKNYGFGVDYSFARPDINMLKAQGVTFAARYLWRLMYDDGVRVNKGISKAEYDALEAAGINVVYIYEEDGKELLGGYDAGVRVAKAAEAFRIGQGMPVKPIYFNVDYDAPESDQIAIFSAILGIASVIGKERIGLYGGYKIIKAAFDLGAITWGMQTYAWSNGQWDSRAQLRQWSNGEYGGSVDFQYAMAEEYGQSIIEAPETPEEPNGPDEIKVSIEQLMEMRDAAQRLTNFFNGLLGTISVTN